MLGIRAAEPKAALKAIREILYAYGGRIELNQATHLNDKVK